MPEEIMIDGVNVAWCKDYDDGTCCNDDVLTLSCEKANCMYKKLKRLEQENKELKKENETLNYQWHKQSEIGDEWYKIAENYRSALEEIREIIRADCKGCTAECDCDDNCTRYKIQNKINEVLQ